MPRLFQLLDDTWPSTIHSLDEDDAAGGSIKGKKGRCWSQPVDLSRADWFLIGTIASLALLYATAPLRFADSQYYSSRTQPTVAARAWLTAETDARYGMAQNASSPEGVAGEAALGLNHTGVLGAMEAAAYSTVVAEVGIFAASLAGGCSVLLALMHAALAWGALAPAARGRIIVFAVAVGVLVIRGIFLNNVTRTLMRWPFALDNCILTSTNSHQLYVTSIVSYVFLCVCLLYKTVRGEVEKRKRAAAAQGLAAHGGMEVGSQSEAALLQCPSETPDIDLRREASGQGPFPAPADGCDDSPQQPGGASDVLAPHTEGRDSTTGNAMPAEDGETTEQQAVPLLPPRHFYLPALAAFFVLDLLAVHPFLGEAWAVTVARWIGIVSFAFMLLGVFAAFATIRYEVDGPICPLLCAALGFAGPSGLSCAGACCVNLAKSCCSTRSRMRRPILPSAGTPAASSSAGDSGDGMHEHSPRQGRCCARSSPHCCVNLMHMVVFPAAIILPNLLVHSPDVECPAWLATGGGGLEGSPVTGPPAGSVWPAGLNASSANDRAIVVGSLMFMLGQVAAASVLAVFVSGAVILDGQSELAARRRDAAADAADTLRRAIGYISHEARGPLNAAVLSLALLEDVDEEEQELAAAGHHISPTSPIGDDELSSERLLGDLATSINASKRHLDDLLLWERAGADGDVGGQARWVWTRPREGWLEAVERAFRSTCEAESMAFDVKQLMFIAPDAGRVARFVPGGGGAVRRHRRNTSGQDSAGRGGPEPAAQAGVWTDGAGPAGHRGGGPGPRPSNGGGGGSGGGGELPRHAGDNSSRILAVNAPEGLEVFVDADRILGVVTNAVSNCIKHTPGGGQGLVSVCCTVIVGRAASGLGLQSPAQSPPDVLSGGGNSRWRPLCLPGAGAAAEPSQRGRSAPATAPAAAGTATAAAAASSAVATAGSAGSGAYFRARRTAPGREGEPRPLPSPRSIAAAAAGMPVPASRAGATPSDGQGSGRSSADDGDGDVVTFPPERGVLQIEVRDNGRGIAQRLLESGKLFQPFARLRQGDDSLRMASSGLGLAIVRSIVVEGMRGRVGLSSEEGEGTTFFARVPVWVRARQRSVARADAVPTDTSASATEMQAAGPARAPGPSSSGVQRQPQPAARASAQLRREPRGRGKEPVPSATRASGTTRRAGKSSRVAPSPTRSGGGTSAVDDPQAASLGCADSEQGFVSGGGGAPLDVGRDRGRSLAGQASDLDPPLTVITTGGKPSPQTATRRSRGRSQGRSRHRAASGSPSGRAGLRTASEAASRMAPRRSTSRSSAATSKDKASRAARRAERQQERDERRRAVSEMARDADAGQAGGAASPGAEAAAEGEQSQRRLARRRLSQRLAASTRGRLAFVVDDERVNRTLLAALLRRWGFEATEFEHGGAVVDALRDIVEAQVAAESPPPEASASTGPPNRMLRKAASVGVAAGDVVAPSGLSAALGTSISSRRSPAGAAPVRLGLGARAKAAPKLPAMVTLDVEMPVLSGFGVLKKRQQMARDLAKRGYREIAVALLAMPVVVVSGNARQTDKDVLTSLGAKAVLTKPVEPEQLAKLVSRYSAQAPA